VADIPMIYNKSHTIISNDTTSDYISASMREQLAPSNRVSPLARPAVLLAFVSLIGG